MMERQGNVAEGLKFYKLLYAYTDTLHKIASDRQLLGLEVEFETERNLQHIDILEQENELQHYHIRQSRLFIFGLGIIVLLIIFFSIVLFRQTRIRQEQQNMMFKQRIFRSQMNPHFIFNALSTIQHSIMNDDPERASKYLSRFSKLVRNVLDSTVEDLIPLEEEINTVESYLALQQVRFPEKLDYKIELDETIDIDEVHVPPLMVQPFVENAIEHGIKNKEGRGMVFLRIFPRNGMIILEIEDDGVGREKAAQIQQERDKDHKSLATVIMQERIMILNKKQKKKFHFSIIDLYDDQGNASGTRVVFDLPV
jgi:LytS/YehU family sensor histidine kinase